MKRLSYESWIELEQLTVARRWIHKHLRRLTAYPVAPKEVRLAVRVMRICEWCCVRTGHFRGCVMLDSRWSPLSHAYRWALRSLAQ